MSTTPEDTGGPGLADLRLERCRERTPTGERWDATQPSLRREVTAIALPPAVAADPAAIAFIQRQSRRLEELREPGVPPVYAIALDGDRAYVVTRRRRGPTLADAGLDGPAACVALLQAARALDALHAVGVAHGDVGPDAVVVEHGGAALTTPGLAVALAQATGRPVPGPRDDMDAFAALVADRLGVDAALLPQPPTDAAGLVMAAAALAGLRIGTPPAGPAARTAIRRRAVVAGTAAAVAVIPAAVLVLATADGPKPPPPTSRAAPPVARGATALGSALAPGPVGRLGCETAGQATDVGTCTLLQRGRTTVTRDGAIRAWAVRGASGRLALQVLRRRAGGLVQVARSQYAVAPDGGPHRFATALAVSAGDQLALESGLGGAAGVRAAAGAPALLRWSGSVGPVPRPLPRVPAARSTELQLRVDVVPGGRVPAPPSLRGAAARTAPPGSVLALDTLEEPGGTATLELVRLPGAIVLDLRRGGVRVQRLRIPEVQPAGRLQTFTEDGAVAYPGGGLQELRWLNPGTALPLIHVWQLSRSGLTQVS